MKFIKRFFNFLTVKIFKKYHLILFNILIIVSELSN